MKARLDFSDGTSAVLQNDATWLFDEDLPEDVANTLRLFTPRMLADPVTGDVSVKIRALAEELEAEVGYLQAVDLPPEDPDDPIVY